MMLVLVGLIGIGIMVFIHELGHFVAAKMNGVAVEVFSLGWGPRLVGFRWRGTMYQIAWFPIGGYCKMKGEVTPGMVGGKGEGQAGSPALPPAPVTQAPGGSFNEAAPWRRIVISAFGPIFNLVFAALIITVIWWAGFAVFSGDNRIVLATDYTLETFSKQPPATLAGLKTGDRVTAIDGAPVEKFQDIREKVSTAPNRTFMFTVARAEGGATRTLTIPVTPWLDKDSGAGQIGVYEWRDPVVEGVQPGSAAGMAGLRTGDRIVGADGHAVANQMDLYQVLASKPAKVSLDVERNGRRMTAPLVLSYTEKGAADLGITFAQKMYRSPRLGPLGALVRGFADTWTYTALTVKGFGLLFQGINLRNAVAGPVKIAYIIGDTAVSGFQVGVGAGLISSFRLIAFLCIVLFLMNLLPIPAMDGGQIVLFLIEIIRGKSVPAKLFWRIQLVGFSILLALLVVVTFNDFMSFPGR
jgi:regulator of sigma E protease